MKKWQLLDSEPALRTPWLTVFRNHYRAADESILRDYYIVERSDYVMVLAQDRGRLVLVRQYRPATDRFYIGLPAGYIDPGESPESAGQRELLEETGYASGACRVIGALDTLPAYLKSTGFVVVCEDAVKRADIADRTEIDEVFTVEWNAALQMIVSSEINEMQAASAILLAHQAFGGFPV